MMDTWEGSLPCENNTTCEESFLCAIRTLHMCVCVCVHYQVSLLVYACVCVCVCVQVVYCSPALSDSVL